MKTCTACTTPKPLEEFYSDKRRPDGRQSHCKACKAARYGDAAKERSRKWCRENPDRKREQSRQWRESNREHYLSRTRDYHTERIGSRDPLQPWPATVCTYNAAHLRVKAVKGRASQHTCADCGAQAAEWSYQGGAEVELTEVRRMPRGRNRSVAYSPDPADYDPRCKPCHTKYDRTREVATAA